MTEITKEDFEAYLDVQHSGVTNMFATTTVCKLSGLTSAKVFEIMRDYEALYKKFKVKP